MWIRYLKAPDPMAIMSIAYTRLRPIEIMVLFLFKIGGIAFLLQS